MPSKKKSTASKSGVVSGKRHINVPMVVIVLLVLFAFTVSVFVALRQSGRYGGLSGEKQKEQAMRDLAESSQEHLESFSEKDRIEAAERLKELSI